MSGTEIPFHYRTVGFGTAFQSVESDRVASTPCGIETEGHLHRNELVVDVGSECWGYEGCRRMVFDHHFIRQDFHRSDGQGGIDNFPSAALAVLFHAEVIADWGRQRMVVDGAKGSPPGVWLVSHRDPDFDAFCACHIVRRLIEEPGIARSLADADLFSDVSRVARNWPQLGSAALERVEAPEARALLLLAIYAARVDQCLPDGCSREASLRFLFMAARERGRFAAPRSRTENPLPNGTGFFRDIEAAIVDEGYNPLLDELTERLARLYGPEVAFIRNQAFLYERDMRRAEILSVSVARSRSSFQEWSSKICGDEKTSRSGIPFWLTGDGTERLSPFFEALSGGAGEPVGITPEHRTLVRDDILQGRISEDGLLIENPHCIFFKDWVRYDLDHSPGRKGFTFTGIKRGNAGGMPRYWISLDPEKAVPRRMHLYDLWTLLQEREGYARTLIPACGSPESGGCRIRDDVLARDEAGKKGLCDPWYDGNAFSGTIIDIPNRGARDSVVHPGDPILDLVRNWVSRSHYNPASRSERFRFPIQEGVRGSLASERFDPNTFRKEAHRSLQSGCLHLGVMDLNRNLGMDDVQSGPISFQIGRDLWRLISSHERGVPQDFEENHLLSDRDWIAVWNRRGIAVALFRNPEGSGLENELKTSLEALAEVMRIINQPPPREEPKPGDIESWLARVRTAQQNLIRIEAANLGAGNRVLRRFLAAVNLSEISTRVADLAESYRVEEEADRERLIGDVLAVASILGLGLAYLQVEGVGFLREASGGSSPHPVPVYLVGIVGLLFLFNVYGLVRGSTRRSLQKLAARIKDKLGDG